jgi:hypothetical protein
MAEWTSQKLAPDLQTNIPALDVAPHLGGRGWRVQLEANRPGGPQPPDVAAGIVEQLSQRVEEFLKTSDFGRGIVAETKQLQAARERHAATIQAAKEKLSQVDQARKEPSLLQSASLARRLSELDKEQTAAADLLESAQAALRAIDARLAHLDKQLAGERQALAKQALAEARAAVESERSQEHAALLAAAGVHLDALAGIEARRIALTDGALLPRVLSAPAS